MNVVETKEVVRAQSAAKLQMLGRQRISMRREDRSVSEPTHSAMFSGCCTQHEQRVFV